MEGKGGDGADGRSAPDQEVGEYAGGAEADGVGGGEDAEGASRSDGRGVVEVS